MPPVSVVRVEKVNSQRCTESKLALNPMVQRQNREPRSMAVPGSVISCVSRSPPNLETARMVPPCMVNSMVEPYRNTMLSIWNGL